MAQEEGASILCGGRQPTDLTNPFNKGYFYEPTVIGNVRPDMKIVQEEVRKYFKVLATRNYDCMLKRSW